MYRKAIAVTTRLHRTFLNREVAVTTWRSYCRQPDPLDALVAYRNGQEHDLTVLTRGDTRACGPTHM